jgi:hypothetical protein
MPISSRFWPALQQVVGRKKLMLRMMEAMGVNLPDAMRVDGGLAFLEAKTKCLFCANEDSCQHWLDADEQTRGTPEFCPNASFLNGLKRADPHGRKQAFETPPRLCPICQASMVREDASSEVQQRYHCPSCDAVVELGTRSMLC